MAKSIGLSLMLFLYFIRKKQKSTPQELLVMCIFYKFNQTKLYTRMYYTNLNI